MALLRQTFALLLERWTGLRTVQADSPAARRRSLRDLDGDIALAVVGVDATGDPDIGLIEHLRELGLPILAFCLEEEPGSLASTQDAGADEAISLSDTVDHFARKAVELVSASDYARTNGDDAAARAPASSAARGFPLPQD